MNQLETFKIEIPIETRQRHLGAISARLSTAPRRRRGFALILVGALLLLPLAAIAAESSLPGEFLYPVKRVLEPVRVLFDDEVLAVNRIDELEALIERRASRPTIDRQVREAETAVARRERPDLRLRLDAVIEKIDRVPPVDPAPTTSATTNPDTTLSTRPPDTTTTPTRETTTTASAPDSDLSTTTVPTRDSTRP